ncbi:MAG: two-component system, OmpR family, operon response regulator KdpE [Bacteroidota bacterium]|nr:two-component system, OmpR family, operon response regulator KdpE [Bacteroidota bacterium]
MSILENILVIDDEIQIRRLLKISLETSGYKVFEAENAKAGLQEIINCRPSLLLLDLGLPDEDGLSLLKKIREFSDVSIIILSVRNSEKDIITALDSGADDYITKPFNAGELLARIRACLRHSHPELNSPVYVNGNVIVDFSTREVRKKGILIKLTSTEFSLLSLFIRNSGKVLTYNYLLKEIWGKLYSDDTQYVRVYIAQLRKKLEDDPSKPRMFLTESGVGYRMKNNEEVQQ